MFLEGQSHSSKNEYFNLLKIIGGISNLFSDSDIPYLYYRAAENIFCSAFDAKNLSRGDTSADASKDSVGIGLKTFLNYNGKSLQKVAEFNKDRFEYNELIRNPDEFIKYIAQLRNNRIESTKVIHKVDELLYHCIAREKNKFLIFEEKMDLINVKRIRNVKEKPNSISFNDSINEYNFNISKSTLFKRFTTKNVTELKVEILKDPYEILKNIFDTYKVYFSTKSNDPEFVILPLFSSKTGKVEEKSGLNQWRSKSDIRKRKPDQIYIPVPMKIHDLFPNFFPEIIKGYKKHFNLYLPNGNKLEASMCQTAINSQSGQNKGKGLMSNPNKELGRWILQDILKVPEGQMVTYEMLIDAGIDSVEIRKIDNENYEIDFKKLNSYYEFIDQFEN